MKKIIALSLAALLLLMSLAACNSSTPSNSSAPSTNSAQPSSDPENSVPAVEGPKDLIIAVSAEPSNLDPQAIGMSTGLTMSGSFFYDTLLYYNSNTDSAEPNIISKWEWTDDITLHCFIRDDVYSVQGTNITANDIKWMFERACALSALTTYTGSFDAENIEILGDYELNLKLKKPDPIALNYLCLTNFGVQSQADWEAAGGTDGVSLTASAATGRYILQEWITGDHMTLVRNDNYWGDPAPYETVTIRYIADATTRQMALQSGDVMAIDRVPQSQASTISSDPNLTLVEFSNAYNTYMIPLDCSNEALSDVRVRQAMNMSINRNALLASVFFGYGTVSDGTFPAGHALYTAPAAGDEWTYDVEAAKALMAEAGYADGFSINAIVMSTNQTYMDVLEFAQGAWREIGITLNIDTFDNATFFTKLNGGEWDAYSIASSGINYLSPFRHTDNRLPVASQGYTQFNVSDETAFHDLLDKLYVELDSSMAKEYAAEYLHYIRTEVPVINLVNSSIIFATSASVQGGTLTPMGDPNFSLLSPR